jgi:glutamate racemase
LDRLNEENNKLRTELKEFSTQLGVNENNKTGFIPYIEKKFEDYKITINFLHAYDQETYFYQKVDFIRSCLGARFLQQT